MVYPEPLMKNEFQRVRIRKVPDIVQEGRALHQCGFVRVHLKRGAYLPGNGERPQGVFKPGMVRPRIDKIRKAELVYAMKPLELRDLEQGQEDAVQPDAAMDGIVHDLVVCQ